MKGNRRSDIYEKFANNNKAILQQYGIIKEGTDISGITSVIFLREINPIGFIQGMGRTVRLTSEDRTNLKTGSITVGNVEGWSKPFGEIIVVLESNGQDDFKKQVKDIIKKLIEGGYERGDVEYIEVEDSSSTDDKPNKGVIPEFEPVKPMVTALFEVDDVKIIINQCYEELEDARLQNEVESKTVEESINQLRLF
jgi:hypothetical protein